MSKSSQHLEEAVARAESCKHGMALQPYNLCRYCIEERLDKIIKLLQERI